MHETNVSHIFLMGFPHLHNLKLPMFVALLIIYCFTICGNILVILLVSMNKNLHSPMYFFIKQVSLLDLLMTMVILPILLHIVLHDGVSMSLDACISQLYVFGNAETSECLILMMMSYDRYVAICNPLRYNSIINRTFCVTSVIGAWLLSFLLMLLDAIATRKLDFCGTNVIDHFFCDFHPILEISCSDTSYLEIQAALIGMIVVILPFAVIILSYVYIITNILNIRSITGRQKAFSTCSSHLTVVSISFGTLFGVYMVPTKGQLLATNKALSVLYTVVTPLLNPVIYSLRNKGFQKALKHLKLKLNSFHLLTSPCKYNNR